MNTLFLGLIAVATVIMAVVQIGVILVLIRLARRVEEVSQRVEREIAPLAERLTMGGGRKPQAEG